MNLFNFAPTMFSLFTFSLIGKEDLQELKSLISEHKKRRNHTEGEEYIMTEADVDRVIEAAIAEYERQRFENSWTSKTKTFVLNHFMTLVICVLLFWCFGGGNIVKNYAAGWFSRFFNAQINTERKEIMTTDFNVFGTAEWMLFDNIWTAAGKPTAVYQHGEVETCVKVIPNTPQPDGFAFEDFTLYKTSRIFVIGMAELNGHIPKEGDTIIYNDTVLTVKRTVSGPCYENIGNYNVMLKIHTSKLRTD